MSIRYGVIGAFTYDNVVNAQGEVSLHQCGGNATYASVGARLWTEDVGVVARIGEDYPREWVKQLEDAGIDAAGVREVAGPHMMKGGMQYDETGSRVSFVPEEYYAARGLPLPEGMPASFPAHDPEVHQKAQLAFAPEPEDVPETYLHAVAFHLSPRFYVKHKRSMDLLKKYPILVTLDPGIWYMRERDENRISALFRDADVVLPSQAEADALLGPGCPEDAVRQLAAFGSPVVALKLGRDGSLVYDSRTDRMRRIPVYPARVRDPTGAGDSYCGGFMVGYVETGDPFRAAMYGTVSASFVVEGFGALYALRFTRQQAEQRLHALSDLCRELGR
jgi:ribokinase